MDEHQCLIHPSLSLCFPRSDCGACLAKETNDGPSDTDLYNTLLNDQNAPLRAALSETPGTDLPADASNEIVAETGLRYVDALSAELDAVDAAASYPTWDDQSTWKDVDGQPIQVSLPDDIKIPSVAEAAEPARLQDFGEIVEPVPYSPQVFNDRGGGDSGGVKPSGEQSA